MLSCIPCEWAPSEAVICNVREKWTFPAKPNLPHTMSIDFGAQTEDNAADSTVVMAGMPQFCSPACRVPIVLMHTLTVGFPALSSQPQPAFISGRLTLVGAMQQFGLQEGGGNAQCMENIPG